MAARPRLVIKGDKALLKKLKRLGDPRKLRKVLRAATNAAAQNLVKGVRSEWPVDSGLSKRSVTKKILRNSAGFSAIVGIDKNAVGTSHGRKHVPSNIDHLIELGWVNTAGRSIPARAPLRKGYENSHASAQKSYEEKAATAIEREALKK